MADGTLYCTGCGGARAPIFSGSPLYSCTICGGTSWSSIARVVPTFPGTFLGKPLGPLVVGGSSEKIEYIGPPDSELRKALREVIVTWLVGLSMVEPIERAAGLLVPDEALVSDRFDKLIIEQAIAAKVGRK